MSDLARNLDTGQDGDDGWCLTCRGRGGSIERQDPVGDGVGFETFAKLCPDCLGAGRCPWCAGEVDDAYRCMADDCGWYPEKMDDPDDPIDYSDWPF